MHVQTLSLADVGHAQYLNALATIQLNGLWSERFGAVETWRQGFSARLSFIVGVTDYISHCASEVWARAGRRALN
jgi:hypothetical protein